MANCLLNHLLALTLKVLIGLSFIGAVAVGYRPLPRVSAASDLATPPTLITSSVQYTLDQADPTVLGAVGFSLSTDVSETVVSVRFAENGPVFRCTATGTSWDCPVFGVKVAAIQNLQVTVHAQRADPGSLVQ